MKKIIILCEVVFLGLFLVSTPLAQERKNRLQYSTSMGTEIKPVKTAQKSAKANPKPKRSPASSIDLDRPKSRAFWYGACEDRFGRRHYAPAEGYYDCLNTPEIGARGMNRKRGSVFMGVGIGIWP